MVCLSHETGLATVTARQSLRSGGGGGGYEIEDATFEVGAKHAIFVNNMPAIAWWPRTQTAPKNQARKFCEHEILIYIRESEINTLKSGDPVTVTARRTCKNWNEC